MAAASLLNPPAVQAAPSLARGTAAVQGLYYLGTGVWPLVSLDAFLAVTGPKTDLWLVQAFGGLVAVVGIALLVAAWRGVSAEAVTLAVGGALALAAVDVVFVSKRVIGPVYLLDAVAEVGLLAGWGLAAARAVHRHDTVTFPASGLHP